jgi:hypothetical protein
MPRLREENMPTKNSDPKGPIMQEFETSRKGQLRGEEQIKKRRWKRKDGTRYYSNWVFRLIVSNATAGGTASMDMNMEEQQAPAEQGTKRRSTGKSSRAIIDFCLVTTSCRSRRRIQEPTASSD